MLVILLLFFILQSSSLSTAVLPSSPPELLKTICDHTINPAFCEQTLKSDPRTGTASDVLTLSKIAYDLATKDSSKSTDYISSLANDTKTKPALKPVLKQCVAYYNLITSCFKNAHDELEVDPETANYDTSVAGDHVDECEEAHKHAHVKVEPEVAAKFQITRYFVNIGFVLTSIL